MSPGGGGNGGNGRFGGGGGRGDNNGDDDEEVDWIIPFIVTVELQKSRMYGPRAAFAATIHEDF